MQGCGSQFFPTNTETFSWLLNLCCPEGRNPGTERGQHTSLLQPPDPTQAAAGSTWGQVEEELQGAATWNQVPHELLSSGEEQRETCCW